MKVELYLLTRSSKSMSRFVGGGLEVKISWVRLRSILERHLYWMVLHMGSGLANWRVKSTALWSDMLGFDVLRSDRI